MIYGLYLSASGVLTNSYRQDVIANNLANAQTVGFKRSLAITQQRRTEALEQGDDTNTNPLLENLGGGLLMAPTALDRTQGAMEQTNQPLDIAIRGRGFLAVKSGDKTRLTRNGRLLVGPDGNLALADETGERVLDVNGKTIAIGNVAASKIDIKTDGSISADGQPVARLAVLDVPDDANLFPHGGTLLDAEQVSKLQPADGQVQAGYLEGSNVDPMTELTSLIQTQRTLEANANMIRMQDQTLSRLVNDVAKI